MPRCASPVRSWTQSYSTVGSATGSAALILVAGMLASRTRSALTSAHSASRCVVRGGWLGGGGHDVLAPSSASSAVALAQEGGGIAGLCAGTQSWQTMCAAASRLDMPRRAATASTELVAA